MRFLGPLHSATIDGITDSHYSWASGLAAQVVGKVVVLTGALMMARKEATAKYVPL